MSPTTTSSPFETVKVLELSSEEADISSPTFEPGGFPLDALGETQRRIVESTSEVFQIAPELPGMASIATMAAAIGKSYVVQDATNGRETHCNLYVIAGAPKSYGKGACAVIAGPLIAASSELAEAFKLNDRPELVQEQRVLEKKMANTISLLAKVGGKNAELLSEHEKEQLRGELVEMQKRFDHIEPLVKQLPSYWIGSSTSAAFAEFLARNDGVIFSYSLEAGELVRIALGKFSKDNAADFDLLLSGYTVEVLRETRIIRGDNQLLPCVSVLWFCQPFLLRELYANEEALERGLTARVLPFAVEHAVIPYDDGVSRCVNEQARAEWDGLIRRILEGRNERHFIQCSREAREVFRAFHNEAVDYRNGHYRDIEGELGRWRENAVRVSGGLCVEDGLTKGTDGSQLILTPEQAERGVRIARWAHLSGLRFMERGRTERQFARVEKLQGVLARQYRGTATLADLKKRNGFENAEVIQLATAFPLVLKYEKHETGGRPSETVSLQKQL